MVDQDIKKEISPQEKGTPSGEQAIHFEQEGVKIPERKEISPDEKVVSDELRREIEMMEMDDKTKDEAKAKADKIEFLGEKEKIEHLLQMAREKGVVFAVQVAIKMGDSYILDILHDVLSQEGFYKKMGKPASDDK